MSSFSLIETLPALRRMRFFHAIIIARFAAPGNGGAALFCPAAAQKDGARRKKLPYLLPGVKSYAIMSV